MRLSFMEILGRKRSLLPEYLSFLKESIYEAENLPSCRRKSSLMMMFFGFPLFLPTVIRERRDILSHRVGSLDNIVSQILMGILYPSPFLRREGGLLTFRSGF